MRFNKVEHECVDIVLDRIRIERKRGKDPRDHLNSNLVPS